MTHLMRDCATNEGLMDRMMDQGVTCLDLLY